MIDKQLFIQDIEKLNSIFSKFNRDDSTALGFISNDLTYDFCYKYPYTKIFFVESGNINFKINDMNILVDKGYFILINSHSLVKMRPIIDNSVCYCLNFKRNFFHPEFMKNLSLQKDFYNFINFCLMGKIDNKANLVFKANIKNSKLLLDLLLLYIENKELTLLESGLLHLFKYLRESKDSEFIPSISTLIDTTIVNLIIQYISINYATITLDSLADYFNYHPNYISKLIKKETGLNFQTHVQNAKLKQASFLLINTDAYIKNISFDLGYLDTSYFNKIFKETYGCTPSQFRVKNRKKNA